MTYVDITLDKFRKEILVSGHSNYDVYGKDIVCASISTAMYMSANLISKLTDKFEFIEDEKSNSMRLVVDDDSEIIDIVIENLIYTLKCISDDYAKNLKIKIIRR